MPATKFTARRVALASVRDAWAALWQRGSAQWLAQHPAFLEAASTGGLAPVAVMISEAGGASAALVPFLEQRRAGASVWRHVAPASFGGVLVADDDRLANDESWRGALLTALAPVVAKSSSRASVVFQPGFVDVRALGWNGWEARPHYNYVSRWERAADFEAAMSSSARRQLKKATRLGLGIVVEPSIEALIPLREQTGERQKFRDPIAADGFAALASLAESGRAATPREFRSVVLSIRDKSGAIHAGGLFAADAHRAYYLMGASAPEHLGSGAPTLLHVEAIRYFEQNNWPRVYDWVGANVESVARFKSEFGPELETLIHAEWRGRAARIVDVIR